MAFLNPWLWLGALVLGVPIWLHLRRKQQTNIQPFSAVRFLSDQPEPRRSPLQLQRLLLLAVRALALLLIVAGFAWPYLRAHAVGRVRESRVYILDNTLSRQAGNGFLHDRDRLVSELGRAGSSVQSAVVELTAVPRVVVSFGDAPAAARQKIAQLQPSHQRGSYLAAFRQANALLADAPGARKRIVLLGDNQQNQWNENVSSPPFLGDVQLDLPHAPGRTLPNLALAEPQVQRSFAGEKTVVNFSVKLTHVGAAREATLVVRANGQTILNRKVALTGQPDTLQLRAGWESDPGAWIQGDATVEGAPDDLPADNRVFFSLPPVTEGKVALLAQSTYLRVALSPDIMRGRWFAQPLDPTQLGAAAAAGPSADVLCLESDYLQSAAARKLVHEYLDAGHGVFLVVNRLSPAIEGCLRELGFIPEGTVQTPEKLQFVLSNHPIFHPFLSPDYGNLQEITVSDYVRLSSPTATPLVVGQSGSGLFFQSSRFLGKLFVAAFGLDRAHTSWPLHQSFIPFLDLTLQAARGEEIPPANLEPGEVARLPAPRGTTARAFVLRAGSRVLARAPVQNGKLSLNLPDSPGLYVLSPEGREDISQILAVNVPAKESELVFTDSPEALSHWRLDRATVMPAYTSGAAGWRYAGDALLQQRLWWWMLIGGISALLLEMGMAEAGRRGDERRA